MHLASLLQQTSSLQTDLLYGIGLQLIGVSWIEQPNVLAIILAWSITFTVVITLLLTFGGLGPRGIIAGSLAAGFQSWMYGGFTPAAGIFATLTSVGMLGYAMPVYAATSVVIATFVAALVWACGAGT